MFLAPAPPEQWSPRSRDMAARLPSGKLPWSENSARYKLVGRLVQEDLISLKFPLSSLTAWFAAGLVLPSGHLGECHESCTMCSDVFVHKADHGGYLSDGDKMPRPIKV